MRRLRVLWVIGAAFIVFALLPNFTGFYTDWLWFGEVGYQKVYATEYLAKIGFFVAGAAFAYFFITIDGADMSKCNDIWGDVGGERKGSWMWWI